MFGNFNSLIAEKSIKTKISTWLERLPITYKVFSETTLPEMLQLDSPLTVVNSLDKESFRVFSPDGRETRIALLKEDNDYDLNHIVSKSEERFFTFELGEIHLRMLRLRYFGYIVEEVKTHPDIAEVTWQIPKNGHYLKISHSLPTAYKEHYTELEGTIATMLNKNNEQTNVLELYKKYTKFFMELGGAPTFMEVSYIKKPSDSDENVTEAGNEEKILNKIRACNGEVLEYQVTDEEGVYNRTYSGSWIFTSEDKEIVYNAGTKKYSYNLKDLLGSDINDFNLAELTDSRLEKIGRDLLPAFKK